LQVVPRHARAQRLQLHVRVEAPRVLIITTLAFGRQQVGLLPLCKLHVLLVVGVWQQRKICEGCQGTAMTAWTTGVIAAIALTVVGVVIVLVVNLVTGAVALTSNLLPSFAALTYDRGHFHASSLLN